MKDRQRFQILDGFRQSRNRQAHQPTALAQRISHGKNQLCACPLHDQVGSSLATALMASEQRLSDLLHDRTRIGQELHDSVLQALYAIGVTLEEVPGLRRGATQAVSCSRDQATDQLHRLIQDIRRMILRVESDRVDSFRLVSELQALAQAVERESQMRVCIEVDRAAEEILTGEEARELVAICREAVTNCIRHARATRIVISLRQIGSRVRLSVRDNGSGFEVERNRAKGVGFAQMENRVRKIGGRLNIRSTVGRGTSVIADIYLEPTLTTI
jgi:two-component system, NarL family, sensor kinase